MSSLFLLSSIEVNVLYRPLWFERRQEARFLLIETAKSDELVLLFPKLYTTWKGAVFIITDVITKVWGTTKHHKNCPSYVLG